MAARTRRSLASDCRRGVTGDGGRLGQVHPRVLAISGTHGGVRSPVKARGVGPPPLACVRQGSSCALREHQSMSRTCARCEKTKLGPSSGGTAASRVTATHHTATDRAGTATDQQLSHTDQWLRPLHLLSSSPASPALSHTGCPLCLSAPLCASLPLCLCSQRLSATPSVVRLCLPPASPPHSLC